LLLAAAALASAQEYPRPYDGFQAGEEAMRYRNDRRLLALNQQLGIVDYYRTWAGVSRYQGFGLWRQDLPLDPWGYSIYPGDPWLAPTLFPQPFPATDMVRQPVGQIQLQTGPNRWESHPVYESAPLPNPALQPLPAPVETPRRVREF
jgi:hypothetical protein